MYPRRKVSINKISGIVGVFLFLVSVIFGEIIPLLTNTSVLYVFYLMSVVLLICSDIKNTTLYVQRKVLSYSNIWIIFAVIFVIFYNQMLYSDSYYVTIRWIYFFIILLLIGNSKVNYYEKYVKLLIGIGFVNVVASFFFLLVPRIYTAMYNIWGYWPTGTDNGRLGYRAGIASHYSENAMIMTMVLLAIFAILLSKNTKSGFVKRKKMYVLLFVLTLTAVILTTKRAHILFGFISAIVTYYLYKPDKRTERFFKAAIIVVISLILFYVASFFVPAVNEVLMRFLNIGEDQESATRFSMWALALKNFKSSPIFGIGWGGYKYQFNQYLFNPHVRAERYAYLNAHNVYLQLLAETGIIGFGLFITGAIIAFMKTVQLLKRPQIKENENLRAVVLFAMITQLFIFMYSFTGNCLYDIMFAFYCFAVGFSFGIRNWCITEEKGGVLNEKNRYINIP